LLLFETETKRNEVGIEIYIFIKNLKTK